MKSYTIKRKDTGEYFKAQCRGAWKITKEGKLVKASIWSNSPRFLNEKELKSNHKWLITNGKSSLGTRKIYHAEFKEEDLEIVVIGQ